MAATPPPALITAELDGWPRLLRAVLVRDQACVFAPRDRLPMWLLVPGREGWPGHECLDRDRRPIRWGASTALAEHPRGGVELDHVKEELALSVKAPHDEAHLVVVCWSAHHRGLATSHAGREYERAWLATRYPAGVDPMDQQEQPEPRFVIDGATIEGFLAELDEVEALAKAVVGGDVGDLATAGAAIARAILVSTRVNVAHLALRVSELDRQRASLAEAYAEDREDLVAQFRAGAEAAAAYPLTAGRLDVLERFAELSRPELYASAIAELSDT